MTAETENTSQVKSPPPVTFKERSFKFFEKLKEKMTRKRAVTLEFVASDDEVGPSTTQQADAKNSAKSKINMRNHHLNFYRRTTKIFFTLKTAAQFLALWMIPLLLRSFNISRGSAAMLMSFSYICSVVFSLLIPHCIKPIHRRRLVSVGVVACSLSLLGMSVLPIINHHFSTSTKSLAFDNQTAGFFEGMKVKRSSFSCNQSLPYVDISNLFTTDVPLMTSSPQQMSTQPSLVEPSTSAPRITIEDAPSTFAPTVSPVHLTTPQTMTPPSSEINHFTPLDVNTPEDKRNQIPDWLKRVVAQNGDVNPYRPETKRIRKRQLYNFDVNDPTMGSSFVQNSQPEVFANRNPYWNQAITNEQYIPAPRGFINQNREPIYEPEQMPRLPIMYGQPELPVRTVEEETLPVRANPYKTASTELIDEVPIAPRDADANSTSIGGVMASISNDLQGELKPILTIFLLLSVIFHISLFLVNRLSSDLHKEFLTSIEQAQHPIGHFFSGLFDILLAFTLSQLLCHFTVDPVLICLLVASGLFLQCFIIFFWFPKGSNYEVRICAEEDLEFESKRCQSNIRIIQSCLALLMLGASASAEMLFLNWQMVDQGFTIQIFFGFLVIPLFSSALFHHLRLFNSRPLHRLQLALLIVNIRYIALAFLLPQLSSLADLRTAVLIFVQLFTPLTLIWSHEHITNMFDSNIEAKLKYFHLGFSLTECLVIFVVGYSVGSFCMSLMVESFGFALSFASLATAVGAVCVILGVLQIFIRNDNKVIDTLYGRLFNENVLSSDSKPLNEYEDSSDDECHLDMSKRKPEL